MMCSLSMDRLQIYLMESDHIQTCTAALQKLISKIKPDKSTAMKTAIVALYTADAQLKLRYANVICVLQLDIDRTLRSKMLRLYDLEELSLIFQVEIYYGFKENLRPINETLFVFDYVRGQIAFKFRNANQADTMIKKIYENSPSMKEYETVRQKNIQQAKKKQEQGSFFGKVKNFFGGDKQKEDLFKSSEVISVVKDKGIVFNINDGSFSCENIPQEWQLLFDQAHLTKQDLKDKQVMDIVFQETLLNQARRQAEQQSNITLHKKVQQVQKQIKKQDLQFNQQKLRTEAHNLPPPPTPPSISQILNNGSSGNNRGNLMDQIRNNKLTLKHVQVKEKTVNMDISYMNKQEIKDHSQTIVDALKRRNKRKRAQDDQDD